MQAHYGSLVSGSCARRSTRKTRTCSCEVKATSSALHSPMQAFTPENSIFLYEKNRSPIKHRIFATRPSLCSPLKCMFQSGGFTARAADRRGPSTSQLRARGRTSILPPSWQCLKSAPFCTLAATVSLGSVACEPPKTSTEYIILSEQCLRVDLFKMIRELWSARPKMCRFEFRGV